MKHALNTRSMHNPNDPLDTVDVYLLNRIAEVAELVDPVPPGLVERSLLAVTLAGIEAEAMDSVFLRASGALDDVDARTIAFTSQALTVWISLSATRQGQVRIDGHAAPAGVLRVELHRPALVSQTASDGEGRFVFDAVDHGAASLIVRATDGRAVSTPVIEL